MARFTMKIAKAQILRKQLNALPDKAKNLVERALLEGGQEIAELARTLAPKGRTGILKASIRAEFTKDKQGGSDRNTIKVGPDGEYQWAHGQIPMVARWVEFGTQAQKKGQKVAILGKRGKVRMRRAQGDHDATAAKPFLFPAYFVKKKAVRSRIAKAVNQAMKDTAKEKGGDG